MARPKLCIGQIPGAANGSRRMMRGLTGLSSVAQGARAGVVRCVDRAVGDTTASKGFAIAIIEVARPSRPDQSSRAFTRFAYQGVSMTIGLPRLVNEKPCAPREPTITLSISGSSNEAARRPIDDEVRAGSSARILRWNEGLHCPKRADRNGHWQVTMDEVARRVEVVNATFNALCGVCGYSTWWQGPSCLCRLPT